MEENNVIKEDKHLLVKAILLTLVLFGIVGGCFYYFNVQSPKKVFTKVIGDVKKTLLKTFDDVAVKNELNEVNYKVSYNVKSNDAKMKQYLDIINDLSFEIDYKQEPTTKKYLLNAKLNYKNNPNIDGYILKDNQNLYIQETSLLDKSLKYIIDDEFNDIIEKFNDNNNIGETKTLVNSIINALEKSIEDSYITTSTKEIKIAEKTINAKATTLKIDKNNINELKANMLKYLREDKVFLEAVAKVTDTTPEEIKESPLLANNEVDDDITTTNISIYTTGLLNEFLGINIETENESKQNLEIVKENKTKYNFSYNGNIKINGGYSKVENEVKFGLNYFGQNDENFSFETTIVKEEKSKNDFSAVMTDDGKTIEVDELDDEIITKVTQRLAEKPLFIEIMKMFSVERNDDSSCANGKLVYAHVGYLKLNYLSEFSKLAPDEAIKIIINDGEVESHEVVYIGELPMTKKLSTLEELGLTEIDFSPNENNDGVTSGIITISNGETSLTDFVINGKRYSSITNDNCIE